MQVNFKSNQIAFKTQEQDPVKNENTGIFQKGKEAWKGTLKSYEGIKAFSCGTARGIKNAVYAGSGLVALDWFGTSMHNHVPISEMIKTPLILGAKALYRGTKYAFNYLNIFNKNSPSTLDLICDSGKTFGKALKRIYGSKNISPVAKWGLPIIAAVVAGYTIVRSKLDYNERAAEVDHRYGGVHGHQDKE